jgi:8-oxo-dGTP diphosphatase
VLVVHRPKYDDWAFPKGKLERGETWEEAAVREVEEETSLRCRLGDLAGSTHYPMGEGLKEVRYFLMECDGEPRAQNEVDEVRWVTHEEALELLSYDWDRELLSSLR